jgi:hypothetical protein
MAVIAVCHIFFISPRNAQSEREVVVPITFLPGETNDPQRWVVWFLAVVDGRQRTCGMSYQALRDHFGADFYEPLAAFVAHRPRIEQVTAQFIHQGRFEEEETLLMRSQDLRGLGAVHASG